MVASEAEGFPAVPALVSWHLDTCALKACLTFRQTEALPLGSRAFSKEGSLVKGRGRAEIWGDPGALPDPQIQDTLSSLRQPQVVAPLPGGALICKFTQGQ